MAALAKQLDIEVGHPVVDKTGLTGKYDFSVEFSPPMSGLTGLAPAGAAAGPTAALSTTLSDPGQDMVSAVQQQLGLRLEKGKGQVDVLVLDKIQKVPTEN